MRVQIFLQAGLPPARIAQLGALAEQAGVQTLWASSFPARQEPFLCLSLLAAQKRQLRVGPVPVSPYEMHPLKIADSLLTLNELSGGRAVITVGGLGHSVARVTGLKPQRRVTAVRECIEILRAAATGAPVNFQGQLYSLSNYCADWVTQPPPLLYVGANGPQMLQMAGEVADGVMLSDVPLSRMAEVVARLQAGRASGSMLASPLRLANFFAWHISDDPQAAAAEARMELVWRGLLLPWYTEAFLGSADAAFVDAHRDAFLQAFIRRSPVIEGVPEHIVQALVDNLTFTGGPDRIDHVADKLRQFAAAGLQEVTLKLHGDPGAALRLIGTRLLPALGQA